MEVANRDLEEEAANEGKDRIAEHPVKERHGAGRDAALEPVPHDELGAFAQLPDEGVEAGEIIGIIGVAHDDVFAAGRADPANQRGAIAACGDRLNPGAFFLGDLLRAVGAAIVGDQDLALDSRPVEIVACLADAGREGFGLVQAWHQDGQLKLAGRLAFEFGPQMLEEFECADAFFRLFNVFRPVRFDFSDCIHNLPCHLV
jgi:hypothetical protein